MPLLSRCTLLVVALLLAGALLLPAGAGAALAASRCGEGGALARSAEITLTAADFFDPYGEEMRTFVATGSLGAVDALLISASPRDIIRSFSAVPARSRLSPYFGEDLKGINVTVSLYKSYKSRISPIVRIRLQQDCARYLRNTFLYY
jgi:hypothetical protein